MNHPHFYIAIYKNSNKNFQLLTKFQVITQKFPGNHSTIPSNQSSTQRVPGNGKKVPGINKKIQGNRL